MPFCLLIQNVAEIGQSVDELWPKKRFSRWRPPPFWVLKISIFGHETAIWFINCCSVPNFIKIRRFFTEIMAILRFSKWRPSAILDFKNLQFLSCSPCRHAILLPHTKFCWNRTIGLWVMAKKAIFKMAATAILNFKNSICVTWLSSGSIYALVYQILSKSNDFSLSYGDLAIFIMAAVRHLGFVMTS